MDKPDAYELGVAHEVLEYLIAITTQDEPYATQTIASYEDALANIPWDDSDLGDLDGEG
jgi:hypothetical protein